MKKIELKNLRNIREKHFLQEDGTMVANIYNGDIHFFKDGKYEEIDNTLIKKENYYTNRSNCYHAYFYDNDKYLMKLEKDDNYLNIKMKTNKNYFLEENNGYICYKEILDNIDLKYCMIDNKVKEEIILTEK